MKQGNVSLFVFQARVIAELHPLIVGWAASYNAVVSAATMSRDDDLVEQRLIHWASKQVENSLALGATHMVS